jgi:hypothetical protein
MASAFPHLPLRLPEQFQTRRPRGFAFTIRPVTIVGNLEQPTTQDVPATSSDQFSPSGDLSNGHPDRQEGGRSVPRPPCRRGKNHAKDGAGQPEKAAAAMMKATEYDANIDKGHHHNSEFLGYSAALYAFRSGQYQATIKLCDTAKPPKVPPQPAVGPKPIRVNGMRTAIAGQM